MVANVKLNIYICVTPKTNLIRHMVADHTDFEASTTQMDTFKGDVAALRRHIGIRTKDPGEKPSLHDRLNATLGVLSEANADLSLVKEALGVPDQHANMVGIGDNSIPSMLTEIRDLAEHIKGSAMSLRKEIGV